MGPRVQKTLNLTPRGNRKRLHICIKAPEDVFQELTFLAGPGSELSAAKSGMYVLINLQIKYHDRAGQPKVNRKAVRQDLVKFTQLSIRFLGDISVFENLKF